MSFAALKKRSKSKKDVESMMDKLNAAGGGVKGYEPYCIEICGEDGEVKKVHILIKDPCENF